MFLEKWLELDEGLLWMENCFSVHTAVSDIMCECWFYVVDFCFSEVLNYYLGEWVKNETSTLSCQQHLPELFFTSYSFFWVNFITLKAPFQSKITASFTCQKKSKRAVCSAKTMIYVHSSSNFWHPKRRNTRDFPQRHWTRQLRSYKHGNLEVVNTTTVAV